MELREDDLAFFITGLGSIIDSQHCMDLRRWFAIRTLEEWPSLPQLLHQTLVTQGFEMEDDDKEEVWDPLSFCLGRLFLSQAP